MSVRRLSRCLQSTRSGCRSYSIGDDAESFGFGGVRAAAAKKMARASLPTRRAIPGVKHIVAVASGKGGVGKSTVAVNLAIALSRLKRPSAAEATTSTASSEQRSSTFDGTNIRVGLMDADIYGPSVPTLMKLVGLKAEASENDLLIPLRNFGISCMSMGFLIDESSAAIWRGPMVGSAIQQLLFKVSWGALDVLVVDLPPGTGDAQLSLIQNVPIAGAVIVSTPQRLALADVRRAVTMFDKVGTRVLGVVENMSTFECPQCHHVSEIFGRGGAVAEAAQLKLDVLGQIPISEKLRQCSDDGTPICVADPTHAASVAFARIATTVLNKIESANQS